MPVQKKSGKLLKALPMRFIQWILPRELGIGSIVYSGIFLKEINSDGSFYVLEDCKHDLLYRLL